MARLFDDASTQYLERAAATVTGVPAAFVCWFYSDDAAAIQTLMSIGNSGSDNNWMLLRLRGDIAGDPLQAAMRDTDSEGVAQSSSGYSVNTWHHATAIFATATDRRVLIDNGGKGTDTTSTDNPSSTDRTGIGRLSRQSAVHYMSGRIAEAAMYDLSDWPGANDTERADNFETLAVPILAAGYSPSHVQLGIRAYWPLIGRYSPEIDIAIGRDLIVNGPIAAEHTRVIQRSRIKTAMPGAAAPAAEQPAIFMGAAF